MAELASGVLDEKTGKGWDQLLPFMFQCVQTGERRAALYTPPPRAIAGPARHFSKPPMQLYGRQAARREPRFLYAGLRDAVAAAAPAGQERLMESALLLFAQLAVYVMGVLAQYMGTIHGLLQVRRAGRGSLASWATGGGSAQI